MNDNSWVDDRLIEHAIDVLNRATKKDARAMGELCSHREECNDILAEDDTIQVGDWYGKTKVGMLGILNGIFGINEHGYGPIGAVFDEYNRLEGFRKIIPSDWGETEDD